MKQFVRKTVAVIASSALFLNAFSAVALADTNLNITGNGSASDNNTTVTTTHTNQVVQNNTADITNNIDAHASTGGNNANDNTGGSVTIGTGNAGSAVDVSTQVNLNRVLDNMTAGSPNNNVTISGNGSYSDSTANITKSEANSVFQTNNADINNNIDSSARTGANDANRNTGGDVTVVTGHALSDVTVSNAANANLVNLGSTGSTAGNNGTTNFTISGNGSGSDNLASFSHANSLMLTQDNTAMINNNIHSNPATGLNDANDNTNGNTTVDTGMAESAVSVDNMANFNFANDNSFASSVNSTIGDNGSFSDNNAAAVLSDASSIFQGADNGNLFDLANNIGAMPRSGANDANRNTGATLFDPTVVVTGHALSDTTVSNTGNANIYGSTAGLTIPGGTGVTFTFDLGSLFSGL